MVVRLGAPTETDAAAAKFCLLSKLPLKLHTQGLEYADLRLGKILGRNQRSTDTVATAQGYRRIIQAHIDN